MGWPASAGLLDSPVPRRVRDQVRLTTAETIDSKGERVIDVSSRPCIPDARWRGGSERAAQFPAAADLRYFAQRFFWASEMALRAAADNLRVFFSTASTTSVAAVAR